jgi:hypothetical protein
MPSLPSLALCFSFILAVAAAASYFAGWACNPFGGCANSQMLGCAAGVMFLAYLVLDRFEADPPAREH